MMTTISGVYSIIIFHSKCTGYFSHITFSWLANDVNNTCMHPDVFDIKPGYYCGKETTKPRLITFGDVTDKRYSQTSSDNI